MFLFQVINNTVLKFCQTKIIKAMLHGKEFGGLLFSHLSKDCFLRKIFTSTTYSLTFLYMKVR